jgi:hypothetical protein
MPFATRLLAAAAVLAGTACAGTIAPPKPPAPAAREAVLILPGFGYSDKGERALRALAPTLRTEGLDLYVPTYVTRSGITSSREKVRRFIRDQRLDRYERVHVFAFLAGAWTLNPLIEDPQALPNLATLVYDRSPYQERAPRVAADTMPLLAWLRHGHTLFELAKMPYPTFDRPNVKVGMVIETKPTPFIKRFSKTASAYGPFAFGCDSFAQPHDDCIFIPLNHGELYTRFGEIWPDVRAFIRTARFTATADRTPPQRDSLDAARTEQR